MDVALGLVSSLAGWSDVHVWAEHGDIKNSRTVGLISDSRELPRDLYRLRKSHSNAVYARAHSCWFFSSFQSELEKVCPVLT